MLDQQTLAYLANLTRAQREAVLNLRADPETTLALLAQADEFAYQLRSLYELRASQMPTNGKPAKPSTTPTS